MRAIGIKTWCWDIRRLHYDDDGSKMHAQQQQQQRIINSPPVPNVEGISDNIISGSDSFHYYYNYAVGFVATIYTCFAKLASRSTVDWASMAIGGIGMWKYSLFS